MNQEMKREKMHTAVTPPTRSDLGSCQHGKKLTEPALPRVCCQGAHSPGESRQLFPPPIRHLALETRVAMQATVTDAVCLHKQVCGDWDCCPSGYTEANAAVGASQK